MAVLFKEDQTEKEPIKQRQLPGGSKVTFVTKIEKDIFEKALAHFKKERKMGTARTGLVALDPNGENNIIIAPGACGTIKKKMCWMQVKK